MLAKSRIKEIALQQLFDSDSLTDEEVYELANKIAEAFVKNDPDAYDDDGDQANTRGDFRDDDASY